MGNEINTENIPNLDEEIIIQTKSFELTKDNEILNFSIQSIRKIEEYYIIIKCTKFLNNVFYLFSLKLFQKELTEIFPSSQNIEESYDLFIKLFNKNKISIEKIDYEHELILLLDITNQTSDIIMKNKIKLPNQNSDKEKVI